MNDYYNAIDKELWELTTYLHLTRTPFNPPIDAHVRIINNGTDDDLTPQLKKLKRYLELRAEEDRILNDK